MGDLLDVFFAPRGYRQLERTEWEKEMGARTGGSGEEFDRPEHFFNRELSWIKFNERVLAEAEEEVNPLFERLRFLAITASNLDEFLMVRVGGLRMQLRSPVPVVDKKTRMTAREQYEAVMAETRRFAERQLAVYRKLLEELAREGLVFCTYRDLSPEERDAVDELFEAEIYPVLTPMAVDVSRPYPVLSERSLGLAVYLEPQEGPGAEPMFAFVQLPSVLPRVYELPPREMSVPGTGEALEEAPKNTASASDTSSPTARDRRVRRFILLEDIVRENLQSLFRGYRVLASGTFRITRHADLELREEEADDLMEEVERELRRRRTKEAVRIEVEAGIHPFLLDRLLEWEEVGREVVFEVDGPLDLRFLFSFVERYATEEYLFPPPPVLPVPVDLYGEEDIFEAIRRRDLLLYHPYEPFDPVVEFIEEAAEDPNVLAIKQTLYRVGPNSPVVDALVRAAKNGKQVSVVVELRARFDEEKNISWARRLEEAGAHVTYGLVGLKVHAKLALVVRREAEGLVRYVHVGTGNYNPQTARMYTDLSYFTADPRVGEDVTEIFNHLSGYSRMHERSVVRVAPDDLKDTMLRHIDEVIAAHTPENPGRIIAKMNSLTDKEMILALYRAAARGVRVDLVVRGISCLRPGIPGVSDRIRVVSLVGRFLEHSRIFAFRHARATHVYISSGDWMTRNLHYRVEVAVPIRDRRLKRRLLEILELYLRDNVNSWELLADGSYVRRLPEEGEGTVDAQLDVAEILRSELRRVSRRRAPRARGEAPPRP
ncbi:MAG: Polyphosphate kinase [Brockia lithotrophica]|uniref:Polyphosphate kinase n=1 Tax=Brockia lithotrophica TaxID=933949 RepID=A0A2T5G974_9BACL|nr:MAG: Polyphosphate kinase [Brockia lithotrophica]